MDKSKPISILLADDHEVVRLGLLTLLSKEPEFRIVGAASTAAEAVQQCAKHKPDVVLLDIRMPDQQGIEACTTILENSPHTRVLFLTSYADDNTVVAAILAGAHGYLLKEIGADALIRSIKIVAGGQSILDPVVTRRALNWMKAGTTSPSPGGKLESLSPQEQAVVAFVAEGKTNKEIAAELGLSDKTVKNYLANIFQKLNISRRTQAAAFFARRQAQ